MKKIKNIFGIMIVAAIGLFATSCSDNNDWDVDSTLGRLFGVNNSSISISAGDTWAEVSFKALNSTQFNIIPEYYIIEVSTDSLYDDIPMGGTSGSIIYGEDGSIKTTTDTIRGLNGDTSYYLRIKGMASNIADSKWVYYDEGESFKTDAEQLFLTSEVQRGDTYIDLVWTAGEEVTALAVKSSTDELLDSIILDDNAIATGMYTVENLSPTTTYTFILYNGNVKRGSLTLATMASMPDADYSYTLDASVTRIDQTLLDEIADEAKTHSSDPNNYSVTIGINPGTTIDLYASDSDTGDDSDLSIPEGMSVTFFGLAGGTAPILNMKKSLDIAGKHSYIRFENVGLVDTGCQYFINESDEINIGEISFTECTFNDFERSLIRLQGSSAKSIDQVKLDNCVATNMSYGNGYSVFYWNNSAYTIGSLIITNTTFNTFARSFIEATGSNTGSIQISDCTFYNGPASGRYFIDANNCPNTSISVSRSIFALSPDPTNCRGIRNTTSPVIDEVYFTNDFVLTSSAFTPTVELSYSSDELFLDPENGDFTIQQRDVTVGDPRWLE